MVYGTYNYSFHGVYKPTNITGGPHLVITLQLAPLMGNLLRYTQLPLPLLHSPLDRKFVHGKVHMLLG